MKTAKEYAQEYSNHNLESFESFIDSIKRDTLDAVKIQLNKWLVPVSFEGYPIKAVPQVAIIDQLKLENL